VHAASAAANDGKMRIIALLHDLEYAQDTRTEAPSHTRITRARAFVIRSTCWRLVPPFIFLPGHIDVNPPESSGQ
jgi:hypothetical protein